MGDRERLELFVRAIQADVWRYCIYLSGRGEAEDLAQEALLRVVARLHRWERGAVRTWVFGVTRNVCFEHRRRRFRRRTTPVADFGGEVPFTDAYGIVEAVQVLSSLPLDLREAIVLTQLVGLSYAEAADVVGCPIGTIRSRVARGRGVLAHALGPAERPAEH